MLYMSNPYGPESGLQMFLLHGVTKAEHELSDSDMIFPKDVTVSVDPVEQVDYENAIEKFNKRELSEMTEGEAKALIRLFDKTPSVDSEDLRGIQKDLFEYYDEQFPDDWGEAVEDRTENLRK
jgi:hypothetical protein